eukprot:CAMPEP_0119391936 /NCGR_PEP_ID=MMETSP1334-20130426/119227_1 /TAXON_ID=127549 /ORGANISM="Calcidiscus leptoporus, Strain RCC1130" /LENGTH=217 /DNA_ID=CAMNT_0007414709 /DNA_START=161 /DNA_END=811 /DNA_ORIENTATION=+
MALTRLHHAGFEIDDRSAVKPSKFAMLPAFPRHPELKWPRDNQSRHVQHRPDSLCTSFKFNAWLLRQTAVLMSDTDVVFAEDPRPWMQARLDENEYFFAANEKMHRNYWGLNTHLTWLRPNRQVFHMLVDAGLHGNYIPYTNTEQDVIESLFTQHRNGLGLPRSVHTRNAFCSCGSVLYLTSRSRARAVPTLSTTTLVTFDHNISQSRKWRVAVPIA